MSGWNAELAGGASLAPATGMSPYRVGVAGWAIPKSHRAAFPDDGYPSQTLCNTLVVP